jgi:S-DNA-T family DNA segregation ATPase FtsK/SpoIIIE
MAASSKSHKPRHEILALVFFAAGLLLLLSLITYTASDPSFSVSGRGEVRNAIGILGSYLADALLRLFGVGAYLIAFYLFAYAAWFALGGEALHPHLKKVGGLLLFASLATLLGLQGETLVILGEAVPSGGMLGQLFGTLLVKSVSITGAYIVAVTALMISLLLLTPVSLLAALEGLRQAYRSLANQLALLNDIRKARAERAREAKEAQPSRQQEPPRVVATFPQPSKAAGRETKEPRERKERPSKPVQATFEFMEDGTTGYRLPTTDLLGTPETQVKKVSEKDMMAQSELLVRKLLDFDIQGRVTQVYPGPVVTMFEFEPAPGVKVSRIVGLANDLALTMKAASVRIVSPLPGKAAVGIEVPNTNREMVWFRHIIESAEYQTPKSKLKIPLGKDIFGVPVAANIEKMPHLLVAGATGSGKSVAINSIILALLFNARPSEVRLVLVDPKMLELSLYNDIPHLLTPVVTQPKKAAETLRALVAEMERRYRQLAEKGAKNIDSYNRTVPESQRLPYIVVIIDELADLMMTVQREVEDSIMRLAQMARAAGIHLIVATQRPSVDVITGLIKANLPSRISFQVSSKTDSRTILDANGAEALLGMGDMLFLPPGSAHVVRVHGCFVSEDDIKRVVDFVRKQGSPNYEFLAQRVKEVVEADAAAGEEVERDEEYERAVELVQMNGQASTSFLQRRLRVGYNRAARMIEMMEKDGIVGPAEGSKPRKVLVRRNMDGTVRSLDG